MTARASKFGRVDFRIINPMISQTIVAGDVIVKIDCSKYAKNSRLLVSNGYKQVSLKFTKTGCGKMFYCPKCNKRHGVLLAKELVCWHCAKEPSYLRSASALAKDGVKRMRSRIFGSQQHIDAVEHRALTRAKEQGFEAELVSLLVQSDFANQIGAAENVCRMKLFGELMLGLAKTSKDPGKDAPAMAHAAARVSAAETHARAFYDHQYKNPPLSANEKNPPRLREDAVSDGTGILPHESGENSPVIQ